MGVGVGRDGGTKGLAGFPGAPQRCGAVRVAEPHPAGLGGPERLARARGGRLRLLLGDEGRGADGGIVAFRMSAVRNLAPASRSVTRKAAPSWVTVTRWTVPPKARTRTQPGFSERSTGTGGTGAAPWAGGSRRARGALPCP